MPDLDYDPKDDLEHVDYSQPIDHSAGSEPSSYLSSREHAQNPNPGQQNENNITNPDVLSKRENTASGSGSGTGANPQMASDGYYRRNVRQHSPSSAAAKKILKKFYQQLWWRHLSWWVSGRQLSGSNSGWAKPIVR